VISKKRIKEIFEELEVITYGHFLFTSGRHGDTYMQCAKLLKHPDYTREIVEPIVDRFKGDKIDIVIGPAIGGIILAYEFARQLGVQNFFAERENNVMTLRRGFRIPKGARVLVVEDVITTGGSVREVIDIVEREEGELVGVAVLVDRTGGQVDFGTKFVTALSEELVSYSPKDCPLCREGRLPLEKPGSKKFA